MQFDTEKAQKFLTEWNDGASISHLQALNWGTVKGKIEFLKDTFEDITTDQAKTEIKKWLIDRGLDNDAAKV